MNKWLKLITVLLVLVLFWSFYFVVQIMYGTPKNNNLDYIPANSSLVISVNGNLAVKSILADFISAEDNKLLNKLDESKSEFNQSSGINLLSDILFVQFYKDNLKINALIVNLNDVKSFNTKFENNIIASHEGVGILILNEDRLNRKLLVQAAESILKSKNQLYASKLKQLRNEQSIVTLWTKNQDAKTWNCSNLMVQGEQLKLKGTSIWTKNDEQHFTRIKPNNESFHLSVNHMVNARMSDSIGSFLQIQHNQLTGFSGNYRSLKIEQENSFEIVPDGDFIFQFKNDVKVKDVLNSAREKDLITDLTETQFVFGEKEYYYSQIDAKTLYLGRTKPVNLQLEQCEINLSIHGSPSFLTKMEGSPLILRLMNIFPAYRVGNGLSNSIQNIDIELKTKNKNTVQVDGEINFHKGKYASIELLRNVLELR